MRTNLLFILFFVAIASQAQNATFLDHPYLETTATADTLVTPDRIYMSIILQESDSKGKKDTEFMEHIMEQKLTQLGVDITRDLELQEVNSQFMKYFLRSQDVLKAKAYSLLVRDAAMVSKVLAALEEVDISNVQVTGTAYSKSAGLMLRLKSEAVRKAKAAADFMVAPINQKVGKALHIVETTQTLSGGQPGAASGVVLRGMGSMVYGSRAAEPLSVDYGKIPLSVTVTVKFELQ